MISRKLVNLRQNTRFAPASPLLNQPTSIASPGTNQASKNSSTIVNTEVVANGSQQQVHHHHHHHFHHHFHKNDKLDDFQQIQQPSPVFEDSIYKRYVILLIFLSVDIRKYLLLFMNFNEF